MAKFTAGSQLNRSQLDTSLVALGLKLADVINTATAVAGTVTELVTNPSDATQPNGDLTNLDPQNPYSADEVTAITDLVASLQPAIAAMMEGTALPAASPSLAAQAAKFTKLAAV